MNTCRNISLAYLGPAGTYTEMAAIAFTQWLQQQDPQASIQLHPCPTIARALQTTSDAAVDWAVVPVENSIEGSVAMTLDTVWQLQNLWIHKALVLPISHACLSFSPDHASIQTVYSHPQGLAQCQKWLAQHLPQAAYVPINSTAEAAQRLQSNPSLAAIASLRAASLYQVPVLAYPINDYPDNCTRFWVIGRTPPEHGSHTSLAFSVYANVPGALVRSLQFFANLNLNLSRIESRPTKRSLGDYLFFIDLEASLEAPAVQTAIAAMKATTEQLRILGSYDLLPINPPT